MPRHAATRDELSTGAPTMSGHSALGASRRPPSLEALREAVWQLPTSTYRFKGEIYTAHVPGCRAVLEVVGKQVNLAPNGLRWHAAKDAGCGDWRGREPAESAAMLCAASVRITDVA